MRNIIAGTLAVFLLGTAVLSSPAEARCWSNGYAWHCGHPHAWYYHHYHHWGPYGYGYGWRY